MDAAIIEKYGEKAQGRTSLQDVEITIGKFTAFRGHYTSQTFILPGAATV